MKKQDSKTALRKAIDEFCEDNYSNEEIVLFGEADGHCYDEGFVGIGFRINQVPVAVYDREVCIEALAEEFAEDTDESYKSADPYTDAVEYWDFNTEGSWIGEQTPIVITKFTEDYWPE